MPSTLYRIKVFVASPRDVQEEREAVQYVIEELNKTWVPKKTMMLEMLD